MIAWELRQLHKSYRVGAERRVALSGASLRVQAGERVGLIGASGSGKSSLARIGLGLLRPDQGEVELFGESTRGWSPRRWRKERSRSQLLLQDPSAMLTPNVPLWRLLRESIRLHRPDEDARPLLAQTLAAVQLAHRADAHLGQLSGGERRRAGLARVLLSRPRLLVADEPTTGLDAALKAELVALMLDRAGPGCAIVLISHDLPLLAWATERLVVMHQGRIVDELPAAALPGTGESHPHTRALLRAAGMHGAPP